MTTFRNVPKEVLSLIFEQLTTPDLLQCQRVCPAWYSPAHTLLLKVVFLTTKNSQVQKFISSFDSNPCLMYLQAVKEMHVFTTRGFSYSIGDEYKLLFRFPNLTKVKLKGEGELLANFTDDMCKKLLQKCPKLDQFEANCSSITRNRDVLYKVRLLLTAINLFYVRSHNQTIDQYLTSFPRLQKINGWDDDRFNNYQQLLQVLQHLVNIKDIALTVKVDQDHFVERYFATLTQDERDILIDRLSNITRFHVKCPLSVYVNSMFITKYLTGLESFMMDITCDGQDWTTQEEQIFINSLHLVRKYSGKIDLYDMQLSNCKRFLPIIEDNILTPESKFRLRIGQPGYISEDLELLYFSIESAHDKKQLTIVMSTDLLLEEFTPEIPLLHNITELEVLLDGDNIEFREPSGTDMYEEFLKKFPMVKKVAIDIPRTYEDCWYENFAYPLVEELRLQIYPSTELNSEVPLSRFNIMFPNLKHLDLYDFGGIWEQDSREFYVDLSNYSLQRLTMDFAPIRTHISNCLERKDIDDQDCCLVELILTEKQHLYKLTLKSLSATHINEHDLQDCTDYIRVKINVDSLQRLEIYFATRNVGVCDLNVANYMQKTHIDGRLEGPIPHITLFNGSD